MASETISVEFNGQSIDVPAGTTVVQLLKSAEMRSKLVAVEINMEIVPHDKHRTRQVIEGDRIEAVTLVGGG